MEEQYYISLIVPVYNGHKFIESLVTNIREKNHDILENIEIILVNDGSKDDSADVCSRLAKEYDEVSFYNKENGGIASARNYGLERVRGKYVTFCDQDDCLKNGYSSFIKQIEDNECDMLISNYVSCNSSVKEVHNYINEDRVCRHDDILQITGNLLAGGLLSEKKADIWQSVNQIPVSVWNCIFCTSLIRKYGIQAKTFVDYEDDWVFLINNLMKSQTVYLSADYYYCWNIREGSESHRIKGHISDFLLKKMNSLEWQLSCAKELGATKEKIAEIKSVSLPKTLLSGLYNATWQPYKNYIKEIKQIVEKCAVGDVYSVWPPQTLNGIIKRILVFSLKYRLYAVSYLMNRFILKRTFR